MQIYLVRYDLNFYTRVVHLIIIELQEYHKCTNLVLIIYSTSPIYLFILFIEFIYKLIAYIYVYKTDFDISPDLKEPVCDDRY